MLYVLFVLLYVNSKVFVFGDSIKLGFQVCEVVIDKIVDKDYKCLFNFANFGFQKF